MEFLRPLAEMENLPPSENKKSDGDVLEASEMVTRDSH
jgi:hypothetical protein